MAVYLPFHGWLVALRPDPIEDTPELPGAGEGAFALAGWAHPALVLPRAYDPAWLRADPRVLSVRELWLVREDDAAFSPDLRGEVAGEGSAFLYFDHEQVVRDLARIYPPFRL